MKKQSWFLTAIAVLLIWNVVQGLAFGSAMGAVLGLTPRSRQIVLPVRRGDSLADLTYKINRRYGTRLSVRHVQRSNHIRRATFILPGMELAVPVVSRGEDRRRAIATGRAAIFYVKAREIGGTRQPMHELPELSQVREYDRYIRRAAYRYRIDPNLVRAIVYMESTHGWYDAVTGLLVEPRSLRPMNVNINFWGRSLGITRKDLANPRKNIEIGVRILRGIRDRLSRPTVRSLATLYNNLSADRTSAYGARVEKIYNEKLWRKAPATD